MRSCCSKAPKWLNVDDNMMNGVVELRDHGLGG